MENIEKRNQLWAFIVTGALILISLLYYSSNIYYIYLIVYIWFGVAYGMMLQYGRFCMASASRDLFAAGVPRMAVGVLIALIFFSLVSVVLAATNMSTFHAGPLGTHELIGGIIFGVGMVLAGGCASGSLYKIGEGNGTSILSIMGISFGQAIFVDVGGIFNKLLPQSWIDAAQATTWVPKEKITSWFDHYFLGNIVFKKNIILSDTEAFSGMSGDIARNFFANSLINTILPTIIVLFAIYYFFMRKGHLKRVKKALKKEGKEETTGFGDELRGMWNMITASQRTTLMGVLIGITAGIHILAMKGMQNKFGISNFGELLARMGHHEDLSTMGKIFDPGYWYITTQEAQFAGWIMDKVGWDVKDDVFFGVMNGLPELWRNPALWMSIGIIFGAMIMSLLNKEFKWKLPKGELIVWGLGGGLLMGVGARIALGCNIGAFFIRVAGGDPGGWLFGIGMVIGGYGGVRFFNWWTDRKMAKEMEAF
ncbi:MAG: YeeE/YedE family protein [Nitrospiraceae bacterium]|nr:MAG: YeeE/YedE family protein [Nitrospiraceae bacterium]